MPKRKNKANDLFLLMLNLSQLSSREKIIDVFLEATSEIWPNVTPRFSLSFSESENNSIEIATTGSHFGFISIENFTELKSENQDLLHNACGMLAVILKKNEHEKLIADEKLHLEKLVEERTQHLNEENRDRKRAEQALVREKYFLQKAQEIGHIGTWELDIKKNDLIWTDENYRIFGLPVGTKLTYETFLGCIHPDDREYVDREWNATFDKKPYDIEHRLMVEGEVKWVREKAELEFNELGDCIRAVGFTQDITKRKQAEEKLLESETKYRHLYETMSQGVVIQDAEGSIIEANHAACEILGLTMDQMLGKTAYDPRWKLIHEDGSPYDPSEMPSNIALLTGKQSKSVHCGIYVPEKDEYRWTLIGSVPRFRDGETKPFLTTTVFTDITELKNLESKLLQTQKMESIGNLAGGIAHDFNNILSSVIGFTELALDEAPEDTVLEDSLQEVYSAGKRAKDLVKQILAFARQSDEKRSHIQPGKISKEVLKLIRSTIPTTIEIGQDIESESLIMGNPTQVHQVLMNLCTNAAHAMEDSGGVLKVSLKDVVLDKKDLLTGMRQEDYIVIEVSDTGVGIAPEIIKSIFDPYFTTKDPGEGTGMGLAMVHGIVESYGGKISVDSQLGKGTTFNICLPIARKSSVLHEYVPEQLPTGTERILLVDDEMPIAKMGLQILERLGYSVTTRTSSIEALELFQSKPNYFDLVVTDMTMPNLTGDKLAVELIKIRPDIPVILCTGYSKKISDETASNFGIKAFAYKPVVKAELAKTVRKVLDEVKE